MSIQVLTVSSKGQLALPIAFRKLLDIGNGDKLAAFVSDDTILLKKIKLPTVDDFKASLDEAQDWAASVGYTEDDIDDMVQSVRRGSCV